MPDNLAQLREDYPEWEIEARWSTAGSGPDRYQFIAHRGEVTVSAWSAAGLREVIEEESR